MSIIFGADLSGNGNNWTTNNISLTAGTTYDSMVDVPGIGSTTSKPDVGGLVRGNYCTLNPLTLSSYANIYEANLKIYGNTGTNSGGAIGTFGVTTGKWYYEWTSDSSGAGFGGVVTQYNYTTFNDENNTFGASGSNKGIGIRGSGTTYGNASEKQTIAAFTFSAGDIVMVALDCDNGAVYFGKNGTWFNSGVPTSGGSRTGSFHNYAPGLDRVAFPAFNAFNTASVWVNFGQRAFSYTPPTGFKTLNTTNLPNPVIKRPSDHFDVKTWTGNGASLTVGNTVKQSSGYAITKGLKFNSNSNSYLTRAFKSAGNRKTFTVSCWFKRDKIDGNAHFLFEGGSPDGYASRFAVRINGDDTLYVMTGTQYLLVTTAVFKETTQWHHLVVSVDTTTINDGNRVRLYIDGKEITAFSSRYNPSQNDDLGWNMAAAHSIGFTHIDAAAAWSGYMAEFYSVDGQALTPSSFGQFDANNNWTPKAYTGTYGTNGFYLPLNNAPALGNSTYASSFGGANSVSLATTGIVPTGSFTLEAWVYVTKNTATQTIYSQASGAGDSGRVWFGLEDSSYSGDGTSGQPRWSCQIGTSAVSKIAPVLNKWTYVAMTFDGSTIRMYVDGVVVASNAQSTNASNSSARVGEHANYSSTYKWNGYISNLRVSNTVRTVTTIPTSALTSDANTRLLMFTTSALTDASSNNFTVTNSSYTGSLTLPAPIPVTPFATSPTYSGSFNGTSAYLSFPNNAAYQMGTGDFTVECWWKPTNQAGSSSTAGANQSLIGLWGGATGQASWLLYYSQGNLYWYTSANGSSQTPTLSTSFSPAKGVWYHVALVRSSGTTQIYINGVSIASTNTVVNLYAANSTLTIGYNPIGGTPDYVYGYLSNVRVVKGVAVYTGSFTPPTTLSATQSAGTNIAAITGTSTSLLTLTTAGCKDTSTVAATVTNTAVTVVNTDIPPNASNVSSDSSGSNYHFGTSNVDQTSGLNPVYDIVYDSPTDTVDSNGNSIGNYATFTESGGGGTFSNARLVWTSPASDLKAAYSTLPVNKTLTGKWYAEFENTSTTGAIYQYFIGSNGYAYNTTPYLQWRTSDGVVYLNGSNITTWTTTTTKDIIGIAYDASTGTGSFYKNGVLAGSQVIPNAMNIPLYFGCGSDSSGNTATYSANFGQHPFRYTPPAGYKGLNTKNLKEVGAYNLPDSFGNFANTPDMVLIKGRSTATYPTIFDTVRGPGVRTFTSLTDASSTDLNELGSFIPNGFTLGSNSDANGAGSTYVGYGWNRGQIPGFDIVSFATEASSGTKRVPHNLGQIPKMIWMKNQSYGYNWDIYHVDAFANNSQGYRLIFTTSGIDANQPFTGLAPTIYDFGFNQSFYARSSDQVIAYLWAEVPGFSKIGSYVGNGSSDGPFINCGFRPKFVVMKKGSSTDSSSNWAMIDSVRSYANPGNHTLALNLSSAESAFGPGVNVFGSGNEIDLLSNGFKQRGAGSYGNQSGITYYYMAWAETPFKYATAR
jgi:hypothetical protein